jgi:hypothetical protein
MQMGLSGDLRAFLRRFKGKRLGRLSATFGVSTAAAAGLLIGYRILFPFRASPRGHCLCCGAQTRLGPAGWADFCARHHPFTPLPPLMVVAEAVSLFVSAIAGWLILRRIAFLGGRAVSMGLVLLCLAGMALCAFIVPEPLRTWHHFSLALLLLVYVLSAAFVDSVESILTTAAIAVAGAALLTFIIRMLHWIMLGYWGLFKTS